MDTSNLSIGQKEILNKLQTVFEDEQQLTNWLSLPNKSFRNKTPLDLLLSGNLDYFNRFFNDSVTIE
jgi:uncharacterized protein (DUF2384 family)